MNTVVVPAGANSTLIPFTVDPGTHGSDAFDVVLDSSQVVISLLLPNSTEVTAANASSFGIQWTTFSSTGADVAGTSPFDQRGNHVMIFLPAGISAGVYQIKANASATTADSSMTAVYYSSSSLLAGIAPLAPYYHAGDTVVLSGFLFDNGSPVSGATATVQLGSVIDISPQATVGNYVLAGQTPVDSSNSIFTYSASLINTASSIQAATAALRNQASTPPIIDGTLVFGNVPANGSGGSLKTFSIQLPTINQFDPTSLSWSVNSIQPSTQISLADSGQFDAAPGDGIYTGTVVPSVPGTYFATIAATGTSLSGLAFSRKATTTFRVDPATASFTSFNDQVFDDDGNGLSDRLVVGQIHPKYFVTQSPKVGMRMANRANPS